MWILESRSLPEMQVMFFFPPLKSSNQSGFYSLSPVPRVSLLRGKGGGVDIGRHRERHEKPSCFLQTQTENVLGIPVCYWEGVNVPSVFVCSLFAVFDQT